MSPAARTRHARPRSGAVVARPRRANSSVEAGLVVAMAWAASRVLMVLVLVWALLRDRPIAEALRGWDAAIYTRLATEGYTQATDVAFFPGVPLLLRGLSMVGLDPAVAGVVMAIICSGLAAWALYRLGTHWRPGKPTPVLGALAACLWLVAPTTVFATVAYTEAPFCAAAFWAWERARGKHWRSAAILATLACTLRVSGLFLLAALVVLALVGDRTWARGQHGLDNRPTGQRLRDTAWMLAPLAVLVVHAWWLWRSTGSWMAWHDAQEAGWSRRLTHPWDALKHTWQAAHPSTWPGRERVSWVFGAEIVSMAVGLVTTLVCLVRRRWAEAVWVGAQVVALGTSYWYMSVNRAVLLWFPLFLLVAGALVDRMPNRRSRPALAQRRRTMAVVGGLVAASATAATGWAWLFFTGQWAS